MAQTGMTWVAFHGQSAVLITVGHENMSVSMSRSGAVFQCGFLSVDFQCFLSVVK